MEEKREVGYKGDGNIDSFKPKMGRKTKLMMTIAYVIHTHTHTHIHIWGHAVA
jgi:hypothetical protein